MVQADKSVLRNLNYFYFEVKFHVDYIEDTNLYIYSLGLTNLNYGQGWSRGHQSNLSHPNEIKNSQPSYQKSELELLILTFDYSAD